jgi:mRNA-degrading endonuclease RelE of RelBE toxin-antitoxin system
MAWRSRLTKKAERQAARLPVRIRELLFQLLREIESSGPVRGNWPNYSKLGDGKHHCHLKKGKPTYVAVWVEREDEIRLVEVVYAGTHEKAPY